LIIDIGLCRFHGKKLLDKNDLASPQAGNQAKQKVPAMAGPVTIHYRTLSLTLIGVGAVGHLLTPENQPAQGYEPSVDFHN
jgi:hypothetical protein